MLKKNADAIRNTLGINEVGKIRTIISTYGAEDTMAELQKDFAKYQTAAAYDQNDGKFKTLSEYVKGRISGTSNTFLNDAEAEQATDEVAVIGDELDIQKAKKRAKAEGITIEQYLDNKSRSMTNRPAFDIDTRAAKLVRESKMGLFGGELTLEEAKSKIMGDRTMGEDAKDLGSTGYTMDRQSDLSAEDELRLQGFRRTEKERVTATVTDLDTLEKSIEKSIQNTDGFTRTEGKDGTVIYSKNDKTKQFVIAKIKQKLDFANTQEPKDDKGIRTLTALLARVSGPKPEVKSISMDKAIGILKQNPTTQRIQQFISSYGKENLPAGLENKKKDIIKTDKTRQINPEGNAPSRNNIVKGFGLNVTDDEKQKLKEWDTLYGQDFNPNGTPKPKK